MPRRSLSLRASPGGLPVPVGCPVLSVWPRRAFLSCLVLFCVSSPGGLLIPPNFPREIFLGGRRVPAGVAWPRDEATAMNYHLPWTPELPAPPWPPLSVPLWRSPSCVPVRVCPEGPPEHPPTPLPGGTVTAWDTPSGRGALCQCSVVCVMCSRLLCPYLVCFLSSSDAIMS